MIIKGNKKKKYQDEQEAGESRKKRTIESALNFLWFELLEDREGTNFFGVFFSAFTFSIMKRTNK
jgi:hypothetical protein